MKQWVIFASILALLSRSGATDGGFRLESNIALMWNSSAGHGVRDAKLGAPMVARSLAIVHICMYDAWAAYDDRAIGTQLGGALRRPASERTLANKEKAVSYAAYRALVDVLPVDTNSVYIPLMKQLGYDPNDNSTDIETPAGIGKRRLRSGSRIPSSRQVQSTWRPGTRGLLGLVGLSSSECSRHCP